MDGHIGADDGNETDSNVAPRLRQWHEIAKQLEMVHQHDAGHFIEAFHGVEEFALQRSKVNKVDEHDY